MKQILSKTFMLLLLAVVCACRSPQRKCLDYYEDFVEEVEAYQDTYGVEDWEWAYEQYSDFEDELAEYRREGSLDREEILRANDLKRRFKRAFPISVGGVLGKIGELLMGDESEGGSSVKDIIKDAIDSF